MFSFDSHACIPDSAVLTCNGIAGFGDALASLRWSKELKAGRDGVALRATSLVHCQEASLVGDDLSRSPPTGVTQGKIRS